MLTGIDKYFGFLFTVPNFGKGTGNCNSYFKKSVLINYTMLGFYLPQSHEY